MAIRHGVTDSDNHFIIDPVTRTIKNNSGKTVLIQHDHNSERFTFECPRYVDEHDMSLCDSIEIHFINTSTGNYQSSGIYEVKDLELAADGTDNVTFTWLISRSATQYVGKLNFVVRFVCVGSESVLEYAWNTAIYSDIVIAKSIYNGYQFVEDYVDLLEQWKHDLYTAGLKIESVEQATTSTEDGGVNIIEMTMTDGSISTFRIQNGSKGLKGDPGNSISSIKRTSGNGAPGSTDTYTITLTDGSTTTFQVYNGSNGASGSGSGDMTAATYDPQGKRTDIFKYVDDKIDEAGTGGGSVDVDDDLSETSTNPVQNKVVTAALDGKQANVIGVEILETICENVVFNDSAPTYTLPSAITLDSEALYYIDCYYYDGSVSGELNEKYTLHAFTRLSNSTVKWGSNNNAKAIILEPNKVTNNWRSSGHTNIISIYKVKINQSDPMSLVAINTNGYRTTAPGGYNAYAEGHKNIALGYATHAEGRENYALGDYSHVEGSYSYANAYASHAEGYCTVADGDYQHVQGKFNVEDEDGEFAHIVGNGTSNSDRKNAHTLDWDGNAWFAGNMEGKQANVAEQVSVNNGTNTMFIWPNGIAGDTNPVTQNSYLWIGSNGEGNFTKLYIGVGDDGKEVATKDDITAAITGAIEGSY